MGCSTENLIFDVMGADNSDGYGPVVKPFGS